MQRASLGLILFTTAFFVGCGGGSTSNSISGANTTGPQIEAVRFVDVDGNGVDRDDILLIVFDKEVYITSASVAPFEFSSALDTLGTSPTLSQSVPRSDTVEILLGVNPDFTVGSSTFNVRAQGAGNLFDTSGDNARPNNTSRTIADFTSTVPQLMTSKYNDSDLSGTVNVGDTITCAFDKPITIPSGATVANNFVVNTVVSSDTFGTSPGLTALGSSRVNRGALITLGSSPTLTVSGTYDSAFTSAGSPSGVKTGGSGTVEITDTLTSGANNITADQTVDLGSMDSNRFRDGKSGSLFPGNVDSASGGVTAHGMFEPGGLHHYDGNVVIGSNTFSVDLLFVADTSNNRVLIFEDKPTGNNADASFVLGQPDLVSNDPNQSAEDDPPAFSDTLWSPQDVHFHAATNQLIVSDSGNHRVLVWNNVLSGSTGNVALTSGQSASIVIGQPDLVSNYDNQGYSGPTSRTLSNPTGIHATGGQLAVADTGNSRIMIWGSIPTSDNEAASTVLGQADFVSGSANRGGTAAAGTLSAPEDVFLDPTFTVFGAAGVVLVADTGNNRALLYATSSPAIGASADVAFGQASLTASSAATTATGLSSPTGITGLDGAGGGVTGRVWVADRDNHRVVVYTFNPDTASGSATTEPQTGATGAQIGQAAATNGSENRGSGTVTPAANSFAYPARVAVSQSSESNLLVADRQNHRLLDFITPPTADGSADIVHGQSAFTSSQANGHLMHEPADVTATAGKFIVADTENNRVLIFNTTPTTSSASPDVVVGQNNVNQTQADQGSTPTAATMDHPESVATDGTRLVVADSSNHRVLIFNTIPTTDGATADIVLGQPSATGQLPNNGGISGARMDTPVAVAVSGTQLYVCDRDNHRVLVWDDFTSASTGATADRVIGQNDFTGSAPNQGDVVDEYTLHTPVDVTVAGGVLYIADRENNRVVGFASVPTQSGSGADFVLGQGSFATVTAGGTSRRFTAPSGLSSDGSYFAIADGNHRVLIFTQVPTATNTPAKVVLGQSTFSGSQANRGALVPSDASLSSPRGLFFDGLDLWVADQANGRLVRFR